MDLGIAGRKAIICASSKGLGKGCAMALAQEGVEVVLNARSKAELEATAAEIKAATSVNVTTVIADVTTSEGREAILRACPNPDILVNNAGGPPMGDFRDWQRADWMQALDANMLAPIELIKATIDGMTSRRFGRIVNITSSAVKAPIPSLGLSNGARSGLTGFVAGLARQVARHNVTINNLLPGSFDTDRLKSGAVTTAGATGKTVDQVYDEWREGEASGRFGTPAEFGAACAFLCAATSGYINGQNLLLDGGTYPGTF
ncbi:SDR family oxidoreductase [Dongia soli]|uniref:SDR family oxidoreductase n=1 Tax=Dongia soli TaxID=600628 RepID=A0ABU5EEG2_9PROT|nr:SDR family oxidoreductase [Dongia soli]MDY0883848.1 SDR family oxidoreductase [Dongia soli]